PFAVGAVDAHPEDDSLVARRTVAAFLVHRSVGILAAIDVVERAEEELSLPRALKPQAEAPVRQAVHAGGGVGDLVAEVTMHPLRRHPLHLSQIERGGVGEAERRCMARSANARAVGMVLQEAPAAFRSAVPVGAVVEIAEVFPGRTAGVGARRPL